MHMGEGEESEGDTHRHSILRDEAREVLDAQLESLRQTDAKALATVRVSALIGGVFVSAISVTDEPSKIINLPFILAGIALFMSISFGVLSYAVDRPSHGIGPGYIDDIFPELDSDQAFKEDLVDRYADWIEENNEDIATDSFYLSVSQGLLLVTLLFFALGVWMLV